MLSKIKIKHLLFAAFFLRLVFFLIYHPWTAEVEKTQVIAGDAVLYQLLAKQILYHFSFAGNEMRTPGYPAFLAITYFFIGFKPWMILLLQILMNCFSVYLLYKITQKVFNETAAIVAAFILAIDPHQILICHFLYPDILFSTLLLITLYILIVALDKKNIYYFILITKSF